MRTVLIVVHVAAGTTGLLLAWPVLFAPKRRGLHTVLGRVYAVATLALCVSAFALFAYDPARLVGLAVLGVFTLACAAGGVWLARTKPRLRGPRTWRIWHLNLMGSSVIAFVTAFAVQMTQGHLLAWILPTLIGSPLIARRTAQEISSRPRRLSVASPTGAADAG
jgi:uncharacterized membrane protein